MQRTVKLERLKDFPVQREEQGLWFLLLIYPITKLDWDVTDFGVLILFHVIVATGAPTVTKGGYMIISTFYSQAILVNFNQTYIITQLSVHFICLFTLFTKISDIYAMKGFNVGKTYLSLKLIKQSKFRGKKILQKLKTLLNYIKY